MEVKEEQTFIFYWIRIPVYSTLYTTGITSVIFEICPHAGGYKHLNVSIKV